MKSIKNNENEMLFPKYILVLVVTARFIIDVISILLKMIKWIVKLGLSLVKKTYKKYGQPKIEQLYELTYRQACNIFDCDKEITNY